jgi:PAS domain S-box-containing protein
VIRKVHFKGEAMQYQYISYIWPLIASALTTLFLGIYAFAKRRNAKGAVSFILCMVVVTLWSSANALEMSAVDFTTKLFWANMQYIAYCYAPVVLVALCMELTGYDQWIRNRKILWLVIIPTIIIILVWTDSIHGLIRYDLHINDNGSFPVLEKKYGSAFFVHAGYSQFLNIYAGVLLIRGVFFKNTVYRKQALSVLIGLSTIVIVNIIYITGLSPVRGIDITPLVFGPAGLIVAWGIFRYKLFDIVPVARAMVIETMDEGIMVLDLQDRILDINPSFEKILGHTTSRIIARRVEEVCSKIPELVNACMVSGNSQSEFSICTNGFVQIFELRISALIDRKGIMIGRLAVVNDITQKKQEQKIYLKQYWELVVAEERERLVRDLHDNLAQVLGFINLHAQAIRQELANADVEIVSTKLEKLVDVTQSAHNEIREYIRNVRCKESVEKGFINELERIILNFEEQFGIKARLDLPEEFVWVEIKPNARLNILNIIKEALSNIGKHAEASYITIVVSVTTEHLRVMVSDDGKGFDVKPSINDVKKKFGLNIMRERAEEIGAFIEIDSVIGEGSKVVLCMQLGEGAIKG